MGRHYFSKETIFCLSTLLVDRGSQGLSTQGPGFIINNIQPCTIFSPGKAKPAQSSGKGNRWQLWFSISARCGMHLIYGVHLVWYAPFVVCTKCGMCMQCTLCETWSAWYSLEFVDLYSGNGRPIFFARCLVSNYKGSSWILVGQLDSSQFLDALSNYCI